MMRLWGLFLLGVIILAVLYFQMREVPSLSPSFSGLNPGRLETIMCVANCQETYESDVDTAEVLYVGAKRSCCGSNGGTWREPDEEPYTPFGFCNLKGMTREQTAEYSACWQEAQNKFLEKVAEAEEKRDACLARCASQIAAS